VEAQRLTDADFLPADPSPPGTDAGVSSENFGGYPDWNRGTPAPSPDGASPDSEPALIAVPDGEPADPAPTDPLADDNLFAASDEDAQPEAQAPTEDAAPEPVEASETEKSARERELEARLAAEQEARTALENQQRQLRYQEIEAATQADYAAVQEHVQRVWNQEIARANGMGPAARAQHLNKVIADRDAYLQNAQARLQERRAERLQEILYHDPTVREGYYTQVITEYGLPEAARADLAALPPELLDDYLPSLKRFYEHQTRIQAENAQLRRELEAAKRLGTGADTMGGNRPGGGRRDPRTDPTSPAYDPLRAYHSAGTWQRGY
jgi:hypothetical protein